MDEFRLDHAIFFLISVSTCLSQMCPLQLAVGDL